MNKNDVEKVSLSSKMVNVCRKRQIMMVMMMRGRRVKEMTKKNIFEGIHSQNDEIYNFMRNFCLNASVKKSKNHFLTLDEIL